MNTAKTEECGLNKESLSQKQNSLLTVIKLGIIFRPAGLHITYWAISPSPLSEILKLGQKSAEKYCQTQ